MEADFNISVEGFKTNEVAGSIGNVVLEVTKTLADRHSLDISKFRRVLISNDFGSALERVTSDYNHSAPSSFTKSKQATAVAQLVSKVGSDGLCDEYTLVLSTSFFVELFDSEGNLCVNKSTISHIVHRLHHELVHIHEKNTLTCLKQNFRVNEYGDVLLISATRVWSEYLANFVSSKTVTNDIFNDFLTNIETVVNEVPDEIDDLVWKFKNNTIPLDFMYFEVKKRIRLIINSYGYAFGYVHGLGIDIKEYDPELSVAIFKPKLRKAFICLGDALEDQMIRFTNKEIMGFNDFADISNAINLTFKAFGINLECADWSDESILHVSVK